MSQGEKNYMKVKVRVLLNSVTLRQNIFLEGVHLSLKTQSSNSNLYFFIHNDSSSLADFLLFILTSTKKFICGYFVL